MAYDERYLLSVTLNQRGIMIGFTWRQWFAIALFILFDVIVLGCVVLIAFDKIHIL